MCTTITLVWPALWLAKAPASGRNPLLAVEFPRRLNFNVPQFLLNRKIIDERIKSNVSKLVLWLSFRMKLSTEEK